MKDVKNIALVFFPINDVGGIITWNKEVMKGFERIGIKCMYFYATPGNKYSCDPDQEIKKERYTQLPGYHLSYNAQNVKDSIEILNQFDAIIFTKSSPHPTKDNLKYKDIQNWQLLYSKTKPPKVVVFHDALWQKTNPWAAEVAEYVDICIAAQKKFIHCVNAYPVDCEKYWDFFPIDFVSIDKIDLSRKAYKFGMVATQWLKWKNHHKFLPMLPDIRIPIYLFGAGMEWHYLKKSEAYLQGIGKDWKMTPEGADREDDVIWHNPESKHVMWGHVKYEELQQFYADAFFSIDLSTKGYTNYTHFEPLCYRTLSLIETSVLNDPDNIIPGDCCVSYDMNDLSNVINGLITKVKGFAIDRRIVRLQDNGQKFAKQMDCVQVAKRIADKLNGL